MRYLTRLRLWLAVLFALGSLGLAACSGGEPQPVPTFAPGECTTIDAGQSTTFKGVTITTTSSDQLDKNWLTVKIDPPTAKVFYQLRLNEGNFEGDADVTTRHWGWLQPAHDDKKEYNFFSESYSVYDYAKFVGVTICIPSPSPSPTPTSTPTPTPSAWDTGVTREH